MFVFWETKHQLNRVFFGKKLKFDCGHCKKKTTFHECKIDDGLKLFSVIDVWKQTKRVMQCGDCLAVCDYYEVFPQEKEAAEKAEAERKQNEQAQLQQQQEARELEAEREKQRLEEEQRHAEDLARQKRAEEQKQQEARVDDELAKLKRQLEK